MNDTKKDSASQKKHSGKDEKADEKEALKQEAEEWKNKYLRALADYQNLEKRMVREQADKAKLANAGLLSRLIPLGDMLRLAQKHLGDPGLEIAINEWNRTLAEEGVERIEVVGRPFNPALMECVEVVDGVEDAVVEEVLPGYKLGPTLLRPAKVKVSRKKVQKEN